MTDIADIYVIRICVVNNNTCSLAITITEIEKSNQPPYKYDTWLTYLAVKVYLY